LVIETTVKLFSCITNVPIVSKCSVIVNGYLKFVETHVLVVHYRLQVMYC